MTDDLVKRLRDMAANQHDDLSIADEAADEIERLKAQIEHLEVEVVWLWVQVEKKNTVKGDTDVS